MRDKEYGRKREGETERGNIKSRIGRGEKIEREVETRRRRDKENETQRVYETKSIRDKEYKRQRV